jgi:hypothetical protein
VVFYSLNYWGVLVWLKCDQLNRADMLLIGDHDALLEGNATYCNQRFAGRPNFPIPTTPVSSPPLLVDHTIKNFVMDWGFPDAVITISGYRRVLNQAVRAALQAETNDVIDRYQKRHPNMVRMRQPGQDSSPTALDEPNLQQAEAYAVVTESLGSYVVLDALQWSSDLTGNPENLICRASQIHMLANQMSLLRLSRIRVIPPAAAAPAAAAPERAASGEGSAPPSPGNCPPPPPTQTNPWRPYIVGYHDPSDLLTFYMYHPGADATHSFEHQMQSQMISVVAPYAPEAIPFVLADPWQAHSQGQETDPRIQDMVSFGSDGNVPNKSLVPVPSPPPPPAGN